MIILLDNKKEAAKILNISVCSFNELIKLGDIKIHGIGADKYFNIIELQQYRELFNENYQKQLDYENVKGQTIIISNVPNECIEHLEKQRLVTNKSRSRQIVSMIVKEMKQKEAEALQNKNN